MAAMPKEARLKQTPGGKVPEGNGWFVLNAHEARWLTGDFGAYTRFEGEERWRHLGINIGVLQPGQPSCYYHAESDQEDFLVLAGNCLLLVEGEERRLRGVGPRPLCAVDRARLRTGAGDGPCAAAGGGQPHRRPDALCPVVRAGPAPRRGRLARDRRTPPRPTPRSCRRRRDRRISRGCAPRPLVVRLDPEAHGRPRRTHLSDHRRQHRDRPRHHRGGGRPRRHLSPMACRSEAKARPVQRCRSPRRPATDNLHLLALDLADLGFGPRGRTMRFVHTGARACVLVNNAGLAGKRGMTASGFEVAFGTNHVGPFLLTSLLLDQLRAGAPARIVTVSSEGHYRVDGIDYDAVRRPTRTRTAFHEYCVSKLANVLHSQELGRRLQGSGRDHVLAAPRDDRLRRVARGPVADPAASEAAHALAGRRCRDPRSTAPRRRRWRATPASTTTSAGARSPAATRRRSAARSCGSAARPGSTRPDRPHPERVQQLRAASPSARGRCRRPRIENVSPPHVLHRPRERDRAGSGRAQEPQIEHAGR